MACEKYSGLMAEAALGALPPDGEREFHAHVALCDDCRGKWKTAQSFAATVNGAVDSLVAGEPSPQFAARLRARIAEGTVPAAWPFLTWPVLSAGALAAVAALFAVLLLRSPQRLSAPPAIVANTPAAVVQPRSVAAESAPPRIASRRAPPHGQVDASSFPFEVLVTKGQLSAALLLGEAARDGRIDGRQLSAFADETAKPLEMKAIDIPPLEAPRVDDSAITDSSDGHRRD